MENSLNDALGKLDLYSQLLENLGQTKAKSTKTDKTNAVAANAIKSLQKNIDDTLNTLPDYRTIVSSNKTMPSIVSLQILKIALLETGVKDEAIIKKIDSKIEALKSLLQPKKFSLKSQLLHDVNYLDTVLKRMKNIQESGNIPPLSAKQKHALLTSLNTFYCTLSELPNKIKAKEEELQAAAEAPKRQKLQNELEELKSDNYREKLEHRVKKINEILECLNIDKMPIDELDISIATKTVFKRPFPLSILSCPTPLSPSNTVFGYTGKLHDDILNERGLVAIQQKMRDTFEMPIRKILSDPSISREDRLDFFKKTQVVMDTQKEIDSPFKDSGKESIDIPIAIALKREIKRYLDAYDELISASLPAAVEQKLTSILPRSTLETELKGCVKPEA